MRLETSVTGHIRVDEHTEYQISTELIGTTSSATFAVSRRFSAFVALHTAMQPHLPSLPPTFPVAKRWSESEAVKANRTTQLQDYLRGVAASAGSSPPAALVTFLGLRSHQLQAGAVAPASAGLAVAPAAAPAAKALPGRAVSLPRSLKQRPGAAGQPTVVEVNYYILSISDICKGGEQSFYLDFYLDVSWRDPRLAGCDNEDVDWSGVWQPCVELTNATETTKEEVALHSGASSTLHRILHLHKGVPGILTPCTQDFFTIGEGAKVNISSKYRAKLTADFMDLRRFPFDAQLLNASFESGVCDATEVALRTRRDRGDTVAPRLLREGGLAEWEARTAATAPRPPQTHRVIVRGQVSSLREVESSRAVGHFPSYSHFEVHIVVLRLWGYYIKKIMSTVYLIVAMSWSVYFIEPSEVADRIAISTTLGLTAIAFNFVVSDALPRIPYMTSMDSAPLTPCPRDEPPQPRHLRLVSLSQLLLRRDLRLRPRKRPRLPALHLRLPRAPRADARHMDVLRLRRRHHPLHLLVRARRRLLAPHGRPQPRRSPRRRRGDRLPGALLRPARLVERGGRRPPGSDPPARDRQQGGRGRGRTDGCRAGAGVTFITCTFVLEYAIRKILYPYLDGTSRGSRCVWRRGALAACTLRPVQAKSSGLHAEQWPSP